MNKITIDLDPLIEFLPKNHHMIEKIKQCEVDKPGTGEKAIKIRELAIVDPVINQCLRTLQYDDVDYKDFIELAVIKLAEQNELTIKELTMCRTNSVGKLASHRGARMQLMMKFILELEDEHWFVNAPDEFRTWFDQDGVPL